MLSYFRRFSGRLALLIATIVLFPIVATMLGIQQIFWQASRDSNISALNTSAAAVEAVLQARFQLLAGVGESIALSITDQRTSEKILPRIAGAILARHSDRKIFEWALLFDDAEQVISEFGTIPSADFAAGLRPELKKLGEAAIVNGALPRSKLVNLYSIIPLRYAESRGWIVLGQVLDTADLREISADLGFPVSLVQFPTNDANNWLVLSSSHEDTGRVQQISAAGTQRKDGTSFTYTWGGATITGLAKRVSVNSQNSDLGFLVEHEPRFFARASGDLHETLLFGGILALAIGIIGGLVLHRSLKNNLTLAAATIQSSLAGEIPPPLEIAPEEAFAELNQSINDLIGQHGHSQSERRSLSSELEEKVYELERRVFETNLVNKIYKETNYQIGLFDVMTRAAEVVMATYGASHAFLFRKAPDSDELTTVFLKKRIQHSGQIVTTREIVPQFQSLEEESMQAVKSEAKNAIASGRVHRQQITIVEGAKPQQVIAVPFSIAEGISGAFCIVTEPGEYFFTEGEMPFLEILGTEFSDILNLARLNDTSVLDPLTRLYNYRHFQNQLSVEALRARRGNTVMSLLAVEIDDFKQFSARNEHKVAEEVLKDIATLLRTICRSTDILSRKEAGLFFILLPETPPAGAAIVTEKIRQAVESNVTNLERGPVRVTMSIGAAIFPTQALIAKDLMNIALDALENAQSLGGNRSSILKTDAELNAAAALDPDKVSEPV